jgi:hypothetical protein
MGRQKQAAELGLAISDKKIILRKNLSEIRFEPFNRGEK